jgi:uncharacterized repeat protein (TIGR01451 family)
MLSIRRTAVIVAALAVVSAFVEVGVVGAGRATGDGSAGRSAVSSPGRALTKTFVRNGRRVTVSHSVKNDVSLPLRAIAPVPYKSAGEHEASPTLKTGLLHRNEPDGARQTRAPTAPMPAAILNFDGILYPGVNCFCAPPDTNGEVGLSQYVQMVNQGFNVFNKTTGASVFGPVDIATLWSDFGGVCELDGNGDPIVVYDQLANRWVISQFAGDDFNGAVTDECIAVSRTSDATGGYYRYDFTLGSDFFDYPKISVWPDAYYMSMNVVDANTDDFLGPQPFAFDRVAMLDGDPATFITTGITNGPSEAPYLPADLDGSTLPPAGAPAPFVEWPFNGTYRVYRFHVDWATPANSTFTLGGAPAAASFTQLCPTTLSCVPQFGTTDGLDALADRLMFRAAYRNFGGNESLVSNFTVNSSGVAGIRWFELDHLTSGTPAVVQESTHQPDTTWRWMGSIAEDHNHDIALGYSASAANISPQIRAAGRLAGDPASTLGQTEGVLLGFTGSQTDTGHRWGDYSDMTVDPVDDCTFWYTQEYYQAPVGQFNWRTRIFDFKFPSCTAPSGAHVTIAKSADDPSVAAGDQMGFRVELANGGADDATGLTFTDALPGATGVDWSVDAGGSSSGWSVTGSAPNQSLVYTPTTLAGGAATHVHVVSDTTTDSCGGHDNTASFTYASPSPGGSGSDSASTIVRCVTITKTADNPGVLAGQQIGFTVALHNVGSVPATGLAVTDDLPAGTGVSWSTGDSNWLVTGSPPNQHLVYTGPATLAGGASTQAHVVSNTTTQSCGTYSNTASYMTDNQGSDQASGVVTVSGCPDVEIFKEAEDNSVVAGRPIGFYVELDNFGDGDATGLVVTDHLPGGSGVSWLIDPTTGEPGWSIAGPPPNQSLVYGPTTLPGNGFTFVHIVSATSSASCGTYANTAQFTSANAGADSSSDSVTVVGCPPPPPPPPARTLSVFKGGAGSATVTSSPAGLNCGPVCTALFPNGTSVTLTEAPSSTSRFAGWSGDCSGTATTCVLSMTADRSVTATFARKLKCKVPKVIGLTLAKAKAKIRRAHCGVGKIKKKVSSRKKKGRVLSQKPRPGKTLPVGSKVNLTVGKGPH